MIYDKRGFTFLHVLSNEQHQVRKIFSKGPFGTKYVSFYYDSETTFISRIIYAIHHVEEIKVTLWMEGYFDKDGVLVRYADTQGNAWDVSWGVGCPEYKNLKYIKGYTNRNTYLHILKTLQ